jgi:hydrogenase maturation protease
MRPPAGLANPLVTKRGWMPPTDRDVLVLGVGNADHGDEGIGCGVVRRLAVQEIPGVVTRCQGRDETNLVELWEGYEVVYLIDAMRAGSAPGTILRFDGHTALIPEGFGMESAHTFHLRRAIELSRALGSLPDQLTLFGVEVAQRAAGGGLSHPVESAADRLAQRIAAEIKRHQAQATPAED